MSSLLRHLPARTAVVPPPQAPDFTQLHAVDARERFRADPVGPFEPEVRIHYVKLLARLSQDGQLVDAQ